MVITKELSFDSAHMLSNYEGKCANLHGHTYHVKVTINHRTDDATHMVMDYNEIKKVFDAVDHCIIFSGVGLRDIAEDELYMWALKHNMRRYVLPDMCKCTAEDMAQHFAQQLRTLFLFDEDVEVHVYLSETESALAEGVAT